ncbi:Ig-like domain-containing protein [Pseudooceanicola sp. MF1-13]|uniref:Ig-like domain-containing protein n=1 Tax=Pseudooceanicola sp. MF1-13 TaxID=3379095 RepID=UPI0038924B6F
MFDQQPKITAPFTSYIDSATSFAGVVQSTEIKADEQLICRNDVEPITLPRDPMDRRAALKAFAARNRAVLAAGGVASILVLLSAPTAMAQSGPVSASSIEGVTNVAVNADGTVTLTMADGQQMVLQAQNVTITPDGTVLVSQATAEAVAEAAGLGGATGGGLAGAGMGGAAAGLGGVLLAGAAGGGGGGSTGGGEAPAPVTTGGSVVDGYIVGARVFRDVNNNLKYDAGVDISGVGGADVFTNETGGFSGLLDGTAKIVAVGGIDSSTGKAFTGVMTAPAGSTVITPLTTLVQSLVDKGQTAEDASATIATKLGLTLGEGETLLNIDPVAKADAGDTAALKAAAKIANVINLAAADADDKEAASEAASKALADALEASDDGDPDPLTNQDTIKEAFSAAAKADDPDADDEAVEAKATQKATATKTANDSVDAAGTTDDIAAVQEVVQGELAETVSSGGDVSTVDVEQAVKDIVPLRPTFDGDYSGLRNAFSVEDGYVVNGSGRAGSTVEVTLGTVTKTTVVDAENRWTLTFEASEIVTGDFTMSARAKDAAATADTPFSTARTVAVSFDVDGPDAPTDVSIGEDTVVSGDELGSFLISGQTEPGATLNVILSTAEGVQVSAFEAAVAGDGSFSAAILNSLQDGSYVARFEPTDANGNPGTPSTFDFSVDTTGPIAALNPIPGLNSASGDTFDVTGATEAGAEVTVYFSGPDYSAAPQTVTADGNGIFSATFDVPDADGAYSAYATAVDAFGNSGPTSDLRDVAVDVTAPAAPALTVVPVFNASTGTGVEVSGTAEPFSSVRITFGERTVNYGTDETGAFSATFPIPADGDYTVTAIATDGAGNPSAPATSDITVDTTTPIATLTVDDVYGISDFPVTLTGTVSEAVSELTVDYGGASPAVATVNSDLSFTVEIPDLPNGDTSLTLNFEDVAGNSGTATQVISVDKFGPVEATNVAVSGDNVVDDDDGTTFQVTGTTEPGATVEFTIFNTLGEVPGASGTATADANGDFAGALPLLPNGDYSVRITAIDDAGNKSSNVFQTFTVSLTVEPAPDVTAPDAPTQLTISADNIVDNDDVTAGSVFVQGNAEAGSSVLLRVLDNDGPVDGLEATVVADGSGTFSAQIDLPTEGDAAPANGTYTLQAIATDAAGNSSTAGTQEFTVNVTADTGGEETPVLTALYGAPVDATETLTRAFEFASQAGSGVVVNGAPGNGTIPGVMSIFLPASAGDLAFLTIYFRGTDITATDYNDLQTASGNVEEIWIAQNAVETKLSGLDIDIQTLLTALGDVAASGTGGAEYDYGPLNALLADYAFDLTGSSGSDFLEGGANDDTLRGEGGYDELHGLAGDDELYGGTGSGDDMFGGSGDDVLYGGTGYNYFVGGEGNDQFEGVTPTGNNGNEAAYVDSPSGINVDLGAGTAADGFGTTDTLNNVERVRGSLFDDTIVGNDSDNVFRPLAGNDDVDGGGGTNEIRYDRDYRTYSRSGEEVTGGAGVEVNLEAGTATDGFGDTDTLSNIQNVRGTKFYDQITGDAGGNVLRGMSGDDDLYGGGGDDTLYGGSGYSYLQGGSGDDQIVGGNGENDATEAVYVSSTSGVTVDLGAGTADDGMGGTDTLTNVDRVRGSLFGDDLTGDSGNNNFRGLEGNDTIDGGEGFDTARYDRDARFTGGANGVEVNLADDTARDGFGDTDTLVSIEAARGTEFDDTFIGDEGDNWFFGLGGNDTYTGGDGADTFVVSAGTSVFTDFVFGEDEIAFPDTVTQEQKDAAPDNATEITFEGATAVQAVIGDMTLIFQGYTLAEFQAAVANSGSGDDSVGGGSGDDPVVPEGTAVLALSSSMAPLDILDKIFVGPTLDADTSGTGSGGTTWAASTTVDGVLYEIIATGSNLVEDAEGNVTGTVTALELYVDGGDPVVELTGLNEFADTLFNALGQALLFERSENGSEGDPQPFRDFLGSYHFDVTGSDQPDEIETGGGNDTIEGGAGLDIIRSGAGDDSLFGGSGDDEFNAGSGDDAVFGGLGHDYFNGGPGNDTFDGGVEEGSYDQVSYVQSPGGVTVDLGNDTASDDGWGGMDYLPNVRAVRGSMNDDSIKLGDDGGFVRGLAGNDTLEGGSGENDQVRYDRDDRYGGNLGVIVDLGSNGVGYAQRDGFGDTDSLAGFEHVWGTKYGDDITGSDFNNRLIGGSGDDTLDGGLGDDTLEGGAGADDLIYSGGHDVFVGMDLMEDYLELPEGFNDGVVYTALLGATDQTYDGENAVRVDFDADNSLTLVGVSKYQLFNAFTLSQETTVIFDTDAVAVDYVAAVSLNGLLQLAATGVDVNPDGTYMYFTAMVDGTSFSVGLDGQNLAYDTGLGPSGYISHVWVFDEQDNVIGTIENFQMSFTSLASAITAAGDDELEQARILATDDFGDPRSVSYLGSEGNDVIIGFADGDAGLEMPGGLGLIYSGPGDDIIGLLGGDAYIDAGPGMNTIAIGGTFTTEEGSVTLEDGSTGIVLQLDDTFEDNGSGDDANVLGISGFDFSDTATGDFLVVHSDMEIGVEILVTQPADISNFTPQEVLDAYNSLAANAAEGDIKLWLTVEETGSANDVAYLYSFGENERDFDVEAVFVNYAGSALDFTAEDHTWVVPPLFG